jgi:membrane-associated phospholipid phosphatase
VSGESARIWRRALLVGGGCVVGLAVVYLLAVRTAPGQRFEDAVLRAADLVAGSDEQAHALDTLDAITVPSVIAAVIVVLFVSALSRRIVLGSVSVGVGAASVLTTEAIQRFAERPVLLAHGFRREDQSFPSGHTTVAMSVMCAVVMVVPYRFRGVAVVGTSLWAAGVGVATVTASWHRPSDTIGADLIVIGYACAAVAVLARWGRVRRAVSPTPVGRVLRGLLAGAYTGIAVVAFAVASVAAGIVFAAADRRDNGPEILLAGRGLALSGSAAVAVTVLALLRHVDLGAPAAHLAEERRPDAEVGNAEVGNAGVHRPTGAQRRPAGG